MYVLIVMSMYTLKYYYLVVKSAKYLPLYVMGIFKERIYSAPALTLFPKQPSLTAHHLKTIYDNIVSLLEIT